MVAVDARASRPQVSSVVYIHESSGSSDPLSPMGLLIEIRAPAREELLLSQRGVTASIVVSCGTNIFRLRQQTALRARSTLRGRNSTAKIACEIVRHRNSQWSVQEHANRPGQPEREIVGVRGGRE